MRVGDFLAVNGWRLLEYSDLGTTARVFVVEKEGARRVLKTRRQGVTAPGALEAEYELLRYLNGTNMARYAPAAGEWLHEVHGFLMEYLRYPTPAERKSAAFIRSLALALRTLHRLPLPEGVDNAWPWVAHDSFESVTQDDSFWAGLAPGDRARLELLRARRESYVRLLPALERDLENAPRALTHGDLAGDNLMLKQDGGLALADWGAARVSAALLDVVHVLVYAEWSQEQAQGFLRAYFEPGEIPPGLEALRRVCQYQACLHSLQALNELGADGLDAVGRAFFERQLEALE